MNQKKLMKNLIGMIIAFILLGVSGVIGFFTGVFKGFSDFSGTLDLNPGTIFKSIFVIFFLCTIHFFLQFLYSFMTSNKGRIGTLSTVISSVTKYLFVILGFCWVLSIIGVNVSTIFASLGVVALILGFGAESLIADMVTGVFVLFENQFNIGDIIELSGFRGEVVNIGIRTTSLKDTGGNVKIINNSDLKNIINRSNIGSMSITQVGVSYKTDLEELEELLPGILYNIQKKHEDVFTGTVDYLGVEELADSSVILKFRAEVKEQDIFKGKRLLNRELKVAFDHANIEIAYPQLDVHTRP